MGSPTNYTQQERGLSSYQLPGCVQKHIEVPNAKPPHSETTNAYPTAGGNPFNGTSGMCGDNASIFTASGSAPGTGSVTAWNNAFAPPSPLPAGSVITGINLKITSSRIAPNPGDLTFSYGQSIGPPTTSGIFISIGSHSIPIGPGTVENITTLAQLATLDVQMYDEASVGPSCYEDNANFTAYCEVTYDAPGVGAGLVFDRPVTAGNFIVVAGVSESIPISGGVSDSNGNSYSQVFADGGLYQVWYCTNNANAYPLSVQFPYFDGVEYLGLEICGVDTLDLVEQNPSSVTTTNKQGFFSYLLNIGLSSSSGGVPSLTPQSWGNCLPVANFNSSILGENSSPCIAVFERVARAPQTVQTSAPFSTGSAAFAVLGFKATTPNVFPFPLGDFIDRPSFDLTRQQCRAFGLWGSLAMTSQAAGSDWLKTLFAAADAAPIYLGNKLYSIPYSEVSAAGNGALYTSPTASGPVANLIAGSGQSPYGDFIEGGEPEIETVDRIDLPNVLQLQIICRENNYNQLSVTQSESASLSLYGMRKADPVVMNCVQDALVARMLLGIMVRRQQYGGDTWKFTLSPRWMLLSPMDLVTLTDGLTSVFGVPVRITSMEEQDDLSMVCEAEPFIYGMCAPTPYTTTSPSPNGLNTGTSAGDITELIIFEPVPELCAQQNQGQIWCVIGSNADNYGGCQVYVSTDGGSSYDPAGEPIMGTAAMGVLSAPWPADTDPDTTNNLFLDMSPTAQPINSITALQRDQFVLPCIVTGSDLTIKNLGTAVAAFSKPSFSNLGTPVAAPSLAWNYELMAYNDAVLTGANAYELMATGAGNELRRSVYGAPGSGILHSEGEKFAVLNPNSLGIFKINLPSQWIGVPLYFKFLSFNTFGSALQSLGDVPAYEYVPTGVPY